jgi:hypothetical protein
VAVVAAVLLLRAVMVVQVAVQVVQAFHNLVELALLVKAMLVVIT